MSNPHDTDWVAAHVTDILFFITGLFALQIGLRLWSMLPPGEPVAGISIIAHFAWGLFLMVLVVLGVDMERYSNLLTGATVAVLALGVLGLIASVPKPYLGTDVILFTRRATQLVLDGTNPYTESMVPAVTAVSERSLAPPGAKTTKITPKTTGGVVKYVSYPAGSFLAFVPQAVTGVGRSEYLLTMAAPAIGVLAALSAWTPKEIAPVAVLAVVVPRNLLFAAVGGVNDMFWVLPILGAMYYWHHDQRLHSGLLFGLAATMKQQPWFIAPFLAVWIVRERDTLESAARGLVRFAGPAAAVFLAVNLPFLVWHPTAWLRGVFTPLRQSSGALVTQGLGVALLSAADIYVLPKDYYMVVMGSWALLLLALYALYWPECRWLAWLAPPLILFANYRSLPSYFMFAAPVALMAYLCARDLVEPAGWPSPTTVREVVARANHHRP